MLVGHLFPDVVLTAGAIEVSQCFVKIDENGGGWIFQGEVGHSIAELR